MFVAVFVALISSFSSSSFRSFPSELALELTAIFLDVITTESRELSKKRIFLSSADKDYFLAVSRSLSNVHLPTTFKKNPRTATESKKQQSKLDYLALFHKVRVTSPEGSVSENGGWHVDKYHCFSQMTSTIGYPIVFLFSH